MKDDRFNAIHKDFFKLYPGIELEQFSELQIYNKNYFIHRQKEILAIIGAGLIDELNPIIPKGKRIVQVTPNSIAWATGDRVMVKGELNYVFEGRFYLYEVFAKYLIPFLTQLDIHREITKKDHPLSQLEYLTMAEVIANNPTHIMLTSGDFYAGAGDGFVHNDTESGGGSNWAQCHDNTAGLSAGPTSASYSRGIASTYAYSSFFAINRDFFPVDLSSLGAGTTFAATSTLKVYGEQIDGANNFTDVVVPTSQADATTLVTGDFDQVSTTEYSDRVTISYNATQYWTFTLNSTCLAALVGTGYNKLGVRNYTYDVANSQPAINQTWVKSYFSEQTGTANDPYYTLTYTVPSGRPDRLLYMGVGG